MFWFMQQFYGIQYMVPFKVYRLFLKPREGHWQNNEWGDVPLSRLGSQPTTCIFLKYFAVIVCAINPFRLVCLFFFQWNLEVSVGAGFEGVVKILVQEDRWHRIRVFG